MNTKELKVNLEKIVSSNVKTSVMIWGAPGLGKSSVIKDIAEENQLELVDVRLSQLAPTDLRGLPFVNSGVSHYAPPSFLPSDPDSRGIIFLDELNTAAPAMQAIAQQLLLDRQIGEYYLPSGWFIWAAGNRVEDRAAVNMMPAPVANRMLHFSIEADLDSWKEYAYQAGVSERIIAFLNFKPLLLHHFDKISPAWPSPRSWEFASTLLSIGGDIKHAVGEGVEVEFTAFERVYSSLPDIEKIFDGEDIECPSDPSILYALCSAFVSRGSDEKQFYNAAKFLIKSATEDWVALYLSDLMPLIKARNLQGKFVKLAAADEDIKKFISRYNKLVFG